MALGCILGGLEIELDVNDQVDFNEGGGALGPGTVAAGSYFPDSATATEDLVQKALDQLNAVGAFSYTAEINPVNGIVLFSTPDGAWQLLTNTGYEDSVFLQLGFPATNPSSIVSGIYNIIYATIPPIGTWYPKTNRDGEDRRWDSGWIYHGNGASKVGPTGKVVGISTGFWRTRKITYTRIHETDADGGLPRAQTCFGEHWYKQKPMRVFADRLITGTNFFDGKLTQEMKEKWHPQRYSAAFGAYEWEFEFHEVV